LAWGEKENRLLQQRRCTAESIRYVDRTDMYIQRQDPCTGSFKKCAFIYFFMYNFLQFQGKMAALGAVKHQRLSFLFFTEIDCGAKQWL